MRCIFRTLRKYWSSLRSKWNTERVTFTKSTLKSDRERALRKIASPIPFQNFLNEVRLTSMQDFGKNQMPLRESKRLRKTALRYWNTMPEKKRAKYRDMADNWEIYRMPLENTPKSVLDIFLPKPNSSLGLLIVPSSTQALTQEPTEELTRELTERSCRSRRSRKRKTAKRRARSRSVPKKRAKSVPRKRRVKRPPEIIAATERRKKPGRKRRMDTEERRSSEAFVSLSKCISRIDMPAQNEDEVSEDEDNATDLSTHRHAKRKRETL